MDPHWLLLTTPRGGLLLFTGEGDMPNLFQEDFFLASLPLHSTAAKRWGQGNPPPWSSFPLTSPIHELMFFNII